MPGTLGAKRFTGGGRTRPGDVTGDGGGGAMGSTGTGEVGRIHVGDPTAPTSPSNRVRTRVLFRHHRPRHQRRLAQPASANIDQINFPRTITTVNGGNIFLNVTFTPTLFQTFRLFIDDSTRGFIDGTPVTPIFDNIFDNYVEPPGTTERSFRAYLADYVFEGEGGGYKSITFQFVPEPAGAMAVMLVGTCVLRRTRSRLTR